MQPNKQPKSTPEQATEFLTGLCCLLYSPKQAPEIIHKKTAVSSLGKEAVQDKRPC